MRTKVLSLLAAFFFLFQTSQGQINESWAKTIGNANSDQANSVAVDHRGGVYIAGSFVGTGFMIGDTVLSSVGSGAIFIAKYDTAGNFLWARQLGGPNGAVVNKMVLSPDGSIYITSVFYGTIQLEGITLTSAGVSDIWLAKLDSNAVLQWVKGIGGTADERTPDIGVDASGFVYLAGAFDSPVLTIGAESISPTVSAPYEDCFVARFAADGQPRFLRKIAAGHLDNKTLPIVSVDWVNNVHVCYYSSITYQSRVYFDSTGYTLGGGPVTYSYRHYFSGYKATNPDDYHVSGLYLYTNGEPNVIVGGNQTEVLISHTSSCTYKSAVNIDLDAQGNEYTAGQLFFYVYPFALLCNPPILHFTYPFTYSIPDATTSDIYLVRKTPGQGITHLSSTRGNGNTDESPSRIAVDTSSHAVYVIGTWKKNNDTSRFHFGNSILTNNGATGANDILFLKYSYPPPVNPPSTLSIYAGLDTAICPGKSVTIGNNAVGGTGPYTYSWAPSTGLNNSSIARPVANPTVTTNYVITVTDAAGAIDRDTVRVIIDSNIFRPTIVLFPGGTNPLGSNPFCEGRQIALSASPATTYQWSNGDTTAMIIVNQTDTLTVTSVAYNGCIGTSLPYIATMIPRTPTPTISASGPVNFCAGNSVTLTAHNTQTPVFYSWNTGQNTASINVTTSGLYRVRASGIYGCISYPDSINVTVNPLPTASIIGNDTTICSGDSVQLTINTDPSNTIQWSNGNTSATIWVSAGGLYSATVTSPQGCSASTQNSVNVNVVQSPPVPTISASGSTTFCAGQSVVLTANNTQANVSYIWNTGVTTTSITTTTAGNYSVRAIGTNGCISGPANVQVVVNPLPTGNISAGGNTAICEGDSIQLTINSSSASSYLWNTGATSQSIGVSTAGNFSAQLTSAQGCSNNTSNTITTTILSRPVPVITQSSNTLTVNPAAASYQWYLNGNLISGATTQSIVITEGGNYSVNVIYSNGCTASGNQQAVYRIVNPALSYQAYPNPVTDRLSIVYTLTAPQKVSITIKNFYGGNVILVIKDQLQSAGDHQYTVNDISKRLHKGIYFIHFQIGDETVVHKILVME